MADVGGDRAQLVLVTALVLATVLVGLALVLNAVIFTENLATRQTNGEIDATQEYQHATEVSVSEALGRVNTNPTNDSHAELRENFTDIVETRSTIVQRDASIGGGSVELEVRSATGGFLLKQTNASRNFTAGGANQGKRNWTLATDAAPDTELRQNVSRKPLYEATADTAMSIIRQKSYQIRVDNGSVTWRVYVFQGAITGNIYVISDRSDDPMSGKLLNYFTKTCARQSRYAEIDFHASAVDGTDCEALSFYPNLSEDVDISYHNTELTMNGEPDEQVRGTYELRVNNSSANTAAFHSMSDGRSPFKVTALTTGEVVMVHQTADLTYESRVGVPAPTLGRVQSAEHAPVITTFNVTDLTDGTEKYDFEVSFDAEDADGNLEHAEFIVTDDEGREIENATVELDGETDSATRRFTKTSLLSLFEDDGNFTLHVYVYDTANLGSDYGETHEADGDDTGSPYPSYGGAVGVPSTTGHGAGHGDVGDFARATPTPVPEEPITDLPTTATPESGLNATSATDTTEGGL